MKVVIAKNRTGKARRADVPPGHAFSYEPDDKYIFIALRTEGREGKPESFDPYSGVTSWGCPDDVVYLRNFKLVEQEG